ncbi:helix-turn-helix transcriptional regulator [Neptuniibacter sp. QD37_11]|uniref:helix-turn-helix transcriptional regulator n=1 Tax=Neptuniibacter sp. QD37_11 TaxID=3398209 RepID=UPI0039F47D6C
MSSDLSPTLRQWFILSRIPRYPNSVKTSAIKDYLNSHGHDVSSRMVQRDLDALSSISLFPLCSESEGRSNKWFWPASSKVISFPFMDTSVALSFKLAREYLVNLLPVEILSDLEPFFSQANDTLKASGFLESDWSEKVAVIHSGPNFQPDPVEDDIKQHIYSALFLNKQLLATYSSKNKDPRDYVIHPLGLVLKSKATYLVGTINSYSDVRQFSIKRFSQVEVLSEDLVPPDDFSLNNYVHEQREFQYPSSQHSQVIKLKASQSLLTFFTENKVAENQTIKEISDGLYQLEARTVITEELSWWLLSRADLVEVLEPESLRNQIFERISKAIENYKDCVID